MVSHSQAKATLESRARQVRGQVLSLSSALLIQILVTFPCSAEVRLLQEAFPDYSSSHSFLLLLDYQNTKSHFFLHRTNSLFQDLSIIHSSEVQSPRGPRQSWQPLHGRCIVFISWGTPRRVPASDWAWHFTCPHRSLPKPQAR